MYRLFIPAMCIAIAVAIAECSTNAFASEMTEIRLIELCTKIEFDHPACEFNWVANEDGTTDWEFRYLNSKWRDCTRRARLIHLPACMD